MPLTLACVCPDSDIAVCSLQSLTFVLKITETFTGIPSIAALHTLSLYAAKLDPAAPVITLPITPGDYTYDLPLPAWSDNWDNISVELTMNSSLTQIPSPAFSAYDKFWAEYYITQDYLCTNPATLETTDPSERAYTSNPDDKTKCEPTPGDLRAICYAGKGVGSIFYKSTPFASCNGCGIGDAGFTPAVDSNTRVDISSGNWCLCASGGSGTYRYDLIIGQLPSGMSLDPFTGCITGDADGKAAGSKELSFQATDLINHDSALVTCGVLGQACPHGPDIFGNQAY